MTKTNETTVRELRRILFNIDDQELTVREIRHMLFNIDDQEAPAGVGVRSINVASAKAFKDSLEV